MTDNQLMLIKSLSSIIGIFIGGLIGVKTQVAAPIFNSFPPMDFCLGGLIGGILFPVIVIVLIIGLQVWIEMGDCDEPDKH